LANEPIAVGHLHLGQSLCVHRIIFANYLIERENIGGEGVYLVVRERLRLLPRHRTPRVIEYGRGIRPIVADQLYRIAIGAIERTTADQRAARAAATLERSHVRRPPRRPALGNERFSRRLYVAGFIGRTALQDHRSPVP